MTVTVRDATEADAGLLHSLALVTFGLACPPGTPQESIDEFVASQLSEERFDHYLAETDRQLLLVENDGLAVGYSMLVYRQSEDPDVLACLTVAPSAELSKVYVVLGQHGTGAGDALVRASVEAARTRGYGSIWLGVNEDNLRANRFYEKQGFRVVGNKTFLLGGRYENDFVRELLMPAQHPA